jgi:hypothetical protein
MFGIYRLTMMMQDGKKYRGFGYFACRDEALEQTWADYPEAAAVNAVCLTGGAQ